METEKIHTDIKFKTFAIKDFLEDRMVDMTTDELKIFKAEIIDFLTEKPK
jgi:hypothetical protein